MKPGSKSSVRWISVAILAGAAVFSAALAQAVLPPHVYEKRAQESKIKAIAVLEQAAQVGENDYSFQQRLRFRLEKSLTEHRTPDVFYGACHSIKPGQAPPPGGTIYYRPMVGQRYFVTVSDEGGMITTLTLLTPALEKALLEHPDKVKFVFGSARVEP